MDSVLSVDWVVPERVKAYVTTRKGGVSQAPFDGFNIGAHVGDAAEAVAHNREELKRLTQHPGSVYWLNQVHGCDVATLPKGGAITADAAYTNTPNTVCAILTADCLPVVFATRAGDEVAVAHAGWRGLCGGVLENTLACFKDPSSVVAYLGPAIGPSAFEVGGEVRAAFIEKDANAMSAFTPSTRSGKWLGDLYSLARLRLLQHGCQTILGGEFCTYNDPERFFSYRRDHDTGRMATLVWFDG